MRLCGSALHPEFPADPPSTLNATLTARCPAAGTTDADGVTGIVASPTKPGNVVIYVDGEHSTRALRALPRALPSRASGEAARATLVYVYDNRDPEWLDEEDGDMLTAIHPGTHRRAWNLTGFNFAQSICDGRWLAADDLGRAWVHDELNHRTVIVGADGARDIMIDTPYDHLISDGRGGMYATAADGTIFGGGIYRILDDGSRAESSNEAGGDLSVAADGSLWVGGKMTRRLSGSLRPLATGPQFAWTATSIAASPDGTVWIGEGEHPDEEGSRDALHRVAPDGSVLLTITLDARPTSIRVDPLDGSVWVAAGGILKFAPDGTRRLTLSYGAFSLALDPGDGSIWSYGYGGTIHHHSAGGALLGEIAGFARDQGYIALAFAEDAAIAAPAEESAPPTPPPSPSLTPSPTTAPTPSPTPAVVTTPAPAPAPATGKNPEPRSAATPPWSILGTVAHAETSIVFDPGVRHDSVRVHVLTPGGVMLEAAAERLVNGSYRARFVSSEPGRHVVSAIGTNATGETTTYTLGVMTLDEVPSDQAARETAAIWLKALLGVGGGVIAGLATHWVYSRRR